MADTLVERVTGQASAQDVEVEVQVVITDDALFGDDDTPGQVPGYGTVPAGWVRDLITPHGHDINQAGPADGDTNRAGPGDGDTNRAGPGDGDTNRAGPGDGDTYRAGRGDSGASGTSAAAAGRSAADRATTRADGAGLREHARVWIRRLYTHPATGTLVAMDSTRRVFDGNLRTFLLARDAHTCRTPWCDAPIRHLDHIHDHAQGGPTTATNGQGLCVRCNHTKQLPGFTARTITPNAPEQPGTPHEVELTTPTEHTYRSTAPPLSPAKVPHPEPRIITAHPSDPPLSPFERYLTDLLAG